MPFGPVFFAHEEIAAPNLSWLEFLFRLVLAACRLQRERCPGRQTTGTLAEIDPCLTLPPAITFSPHKSIEAHRQTTPSAGRREKFGCSSCQKHDSPRFRWGVVNARPQTWLSREDVDQGGGG